MGLVPHAHNSVVREPDAPCLDILLRIPENALKFASSHPFIVLLERILALDFAPCLS
jgi:hypothetical protein